MGLDCRISFEEAIAEERLLKPRFNELALPQQVALKALYGCQLSDKIGDGAFTELDWWSAQQGEGIYDDLGYMVGVKRRLPYEPKEYTEGWIIGGRRAGKTDAFAATIVAYEAICGGHEDYIRKGQRAVCYQIAQDLRMARYSLHFIRATLESMRFISKSHITEVTADRIDLKNGITIATVPPTTKAVRGYANPVAVLDEVGVWAVEEDSANRDKDVLDSVSPGQAQFPHAKIVGISSPWAKAGILYDRFEAGTEGRRLPTTKRTQYQNQLVVYMTSAASGNPRVTKKWLLGRLASDPRAFERECLAKFQDSLSGFLPTSLLQEAVDSGVKERPPQPLNFYVAAIDPAFRNDAFGFAICHAAGASSEAPAGSIVFDVVRRWKAPYGEILDPSAILREITPILGAYRIISVLSDQYQFESLSKLAMDMGWSIENFRFTGTSKQNLYGNLQQLLHQKRLRLLDNPEAVNELARLEAKLTDQRQMRISAPEGEHDDLATVIALAASRAVWMLPAVAVRPENEEPDPVHYNRRYEEELTERCVKQSKERRNVLSAISPQEIWD